MSSALDGRVAVITGAAGGLGREYAHLFAAEGARLVLADRVANDSNAGGDPLEELVDELRRAGADVTAVRGDVGAEESANALVETALARFGALDVLVNNAGNWYDGPIERRRSVLGTRLCTFTCAATSSRCEPRHATGRTCIPQDNRLRHVSSTQPHARH